MLNVSSLSNEEILNILSQALEIANGKEFKAKESIFVSNLFFENSTRTKISFEVAERKLGLNVIPFDVSQSSVNKGENLYDTIKTLQSIGINLAVIRHPQNEYYNELKNIELTILIGKYSMDYYLKGQMKKNLTETVRCFDEYLPRYFPIVHPSPLNFRWQAKNPWFIENVVPVLQKTVKNILK